MTLANAVEAADGSRGLATLLAADAAGGAKTIAKVLRRLPCRSINRPTRRL